MAHEFVINVGQGNPKHNPAYSNWYGMDSWVKEYGVLNGTWLTDTIGDECCLRDMGLTFSTLFSGVRHDSGDPFVGFPGSFAFFGGGNSGFYLGME